MNDELMAYIEAERLVVRALNQDSAPAFPERKDGYQLMARLTAAERRSIPKSKFGVPSKAPGPGSYPMNDRTHQVKAEQFATKEENAGKLSPAQASRIRAKAQRLLQKGK